MLIGIDLDNTIACYDEAFLNLARDMELVPATFCGGKKAVRDAVRAGPGGDVAWQQLQACLYGKEIGRAKLASGIDELLGRARKRDIPVVIVSYKTQFSPFDPQTDLRAAALAWMNDNGLFDAERTGVRREDVYFEATRIDKIRRIEALGCTHFIDDLDEVFAESEFPSAVKAYLYAGVCEAVPAGNFRAFRSHREIADHLLGVDPAVAAAALSGGRVNDIVPILKGGNNRLYRVSLPGRTVALKSYPSPDDDPRHRLDTEYNAILFLREQGEDAVPAALAMDRSMNAALYEWVEGEPIAAPTVEDLDQVLAFTGRLHRYSARPAASKLPLASEACLSGGELLAQIDRRLKRLAEVGRREPDLAEFLRRLQDRLGAMPPIPDAQHDLPAEYRTLSPSDFGFHNALRRRDGKIVFLDFEYFGWDDPVKLTADFLLHPAMHLEQDQRRYIARGMAGIFKSDPTFVPRLRRLLPFYALRWCLIMLGEYLPERWARRAVAGEIGQEVAKLRQLAKAEVMLGRAAGAAGDIP